jgi:hypothetical protein
MSDNNSQKPIKKSKQLVPHLTDEEKARMRGHSSSNSNPKWKGIEKSVKNNRWPSQRG